MGAVLRPSVRFQRPVDLAVAVENAETAHLLILAVLAVVAGFHTVWGWWQTAGWLLVFNALFNAYPVLSLRYLRVRGSRTFARYRLPNKRLQPAAAGATLSRRG